MPGKTVLKASKWHKWNLIRSADDLFRMQPMTEMYSPKMLKQFLERYPQVYMKPDNSYGGKDVIKIRSDGEGAFYVLQKQNEHLFNDFISLRKWLKDFKKNRSFIIQEGISLLGIKNQTVDMRTIVQKNEQGEWEVTGMFAKKARKGMVVTNVKAGGKPMRIRSYLSQAGLDKARKTKVVRRLKNVSRRICRILGRNYKNTIYGLDIGLDETGKLWLIEINTKPSIRILKKISPSMFNRSKQVRLLYQKENTII